jgi:anaerobic ribonucleoside-triphosphate reductase activating protein
VEIAEVISSISEWLPLADGITISGGEPFEQPAVLKTLLAKLRPLSTGDILVYSGFPLEQIQYHLDEMNGLIDALITEPFLKDEMQTLPLRGSDNQKLVILTRLGKERYSDIDTTQSQSVKRLDIMFDDDSNTVWIAGIPQRGDLEKLSLLLNSQGLLNRTSEEDSGGSTPCHKN